MQDPNLNPKSSLGAVISDLENDLKSYEKSANPLTFIVKRKKAIIAQLTQIDSELDFFSKNQLFQQLHKEIERITKEDTEIERVAINIDLKPFTNKQSIVNVKYYVTP